MWLTMSRWTLGRQATRPLRRRLGDLVSIPASAGDEGRASAVTKAMDGGVGAVGFVGVVVFSFIYVSVFVFVFLCGAWSQRRQVRGIAIPLFTYGVEKSIWSIWRADFSKYFLAPEFEQTPVEAF